jgi:Beta propeller domain
VSLFDVSDPAKPTRLSNKLVGAGSSSDVEFDPHAFLWWDPLKLAVIPVQVYDYQSNAKPEQFIGAIGFHAARADGISEAGRVSHPEDGSGYAPPIARSLVVGDRLFTISSAGALASDLGSFADRGFVAFPARG